MMAADEGDPRPVFLADDVHATEPTWTADGEYILVVRRQLFSRGGSGIWKYCRAGGEEMEIIDTDTAGPRPMRSG